MPKIFIKKTLCFLLTLLTCMTLVLLPDSSAQFGSPEYVVRVIYFLPSDQAPQPDINEKLDKLIKDTQLFFADQMTAHGFSRKTFRFEGDTAGKLVVHRLNGRFNDAYYHSNTWEKVWQEIEGRFHLPNNIWLTALDVSTEVIDNAWCGQGGGSSLGGLALMPASGDCFTVSTTAHELGHAFGLMHDNRVNGRWVVSVHTRTQPDRMITSFCSAEWLDVHRYFEINYALSKNQRITVETLEPSLISSSPSAHSSSSPSVPLDVSHLCGAGALDGREYFKVNETVPGDALPTFQMLGPPSLAAVPNAIRLRFRVVDGDGIHQVRLHTPEWNPYVAGEFIACQQVNRTNTIVEFVTTELSPRSESVHLWTIDTQGNFGWSESYPINLTNVLPRATVVSIPDRQLAAAVREQIGNITTRSLLNLRVVDGSNHPGITNLTGLEQAYNLKYLRNVHEGEITDVSPLANLTGLMLLELNGHQIRDISALRNLTNLTINLSLNRNQISDITVLRNLTNLKALGLGTNQISDITVLANLTNLNGWLELSANRISDITALANLTNLKALGLRTNQISDITALANLTNLQWWLDLGANQIKDITALRNLTNLRRLYLWSNQITDVSPLVGLVNLEELYLAGNPIEDLSPLQTLLAKNPNLKIDIEVPRPPPPIAFSPSAIADQTFTVGEVVNLTLPIATGGTPPYTYTLAPLPGGLSFDETKRELSGTPTTAETISTTYTAMDAASVSASLTFTIEVKAGVILDVNGDGQVTVIDLAMVALFYGTLVPADTRLPADVNADGTVDILDLTAVAQAIDTTENVLSLKNVEIALLIAAEQAVELEAIAAAPRRTNTLGSAVSVSVRFTTKNVADALAAVRKDVRFRKSIPAMLETFLAHLIEITTTPDTTALLPNYPNPFNPETWIPYHLSKDAAVVLTIYDVRGSRVRELSLGHQAAGVYESRGRSAYWDGKNQLGEPVASGVYFYTLTAGEFTATRKMLIAK